MFDKNKTLKRALNNEANLRKLYNIVKYEEKNANQNKKW